MRWGNTGFSRNDLPADPRSISSTSYHKCQDTPDVCQACRLPLFVRMVCRCDKCPGFRVPSGKEKAYAVANSSSPRLADFTLSSERRDQ